MSDSSGSLVSGIGRSFPWRRFSGKQAPDGFPPEAVRRIFLLTGKRLMAGRGLGGRLAGIVIGRLFWSRGFVPQHRRWRDCPEAATPAGLQSAIPESRECAARTSAGSAGSAGENRRQGRQPGNRRFPPSPLALAGLEAARRAAAGARHSRPVRAAFTAAAIASGGGEATNNPGQPAACAAGVPSRLGGAAL